MITDPNLRGDYSRAAADYTVSQDWGAHSADEHVPLAQVETCAAVLAAWVRRQLLP